MTDSRALVCFSLVITLAFALACDRMTGSASAAAPPTPAMPSHWKVTSDIDFAAADIAPVAQKLGGKVSALRNTTYDVGGKQVKLNTIVAASDAACSPLLVDVDLDGHQDLLVPTGQLLDLDHPDRRAQVEALRGEGTLEDEDWRATLLRFEALAQPNLAFRNLGELPLFPGKWSNCLHKGTRGLGPVPKSIGQHCPGSTYRG